MNNNDEAGWFALATLDRVRRVDATCRRFESAWGSGEKPPRLEEFLADCPQEEREALLDELLVIEVELRRGCGEQPTAAEYLSRFPNLSSVIAEVFDAATDLRHLDETELISSKLPIEKCFGPYRILREIGRGGMGIVYEAFHEPLNRRVALKVLKAHPAAGSQQLRRFRREARAVARLQHPAIVPVFDIGEHEGICYFAMRLIEGRNLDQVLKELCAGTTALTSTPNGDIRPGTAEYFRKIAEFGLGVAEALAHAHGTGTLHRDIKPSNLLLDNHGQIWVSDFGLAKVEADSASLTAPDQILGTPRYLPPEAFEGCWDTRSDIYGLGVSLYELLTLRPAFPAKKHHELFHQILNVPPAKPSKICPEIPHELEKIVMRALRRRPEDRHASAAELAGDLRKFVRGELRSPRRRTLRAGLLAVAVLSAILGSVLFAKMWYRYEERPQQGPCGHPANRYADEDLPGVVMAPARLANGRRWQMIRKAPMRIEAVAWSPDGKSLAVGDVVGTIRVLDVSTDPPRLQRVLLGNRGPVHALDWSPSGKLASAGADLTVRAWDADGQPLALWRGHQAPVRSVAWSPDETQLVSGSEDRTVRLWQLSVDEGRVLCQDSAAGVTHVRWCAGGERILTASGQSACIWNKDGSLHETLDHGNRLRAAALAPNGNMVATSGADDRVKVWRMGQKTPEAVFDLVAHGLAWQPDGEHLAAIANQATSQLLRCRWDGTQQQKLADLGKNTADGLAWSPAGLDRLAVGGRGGALHVWSKKHGVQILLPPAEEIDAAYSLAWLPDGRLLATNPVLHCWAADGKAARAVAPGLIRDEITLTQDGKWIVGVNSEKRHIEFWSLDGKPGPAIAGRYIRFAPQDNRSCVLSDNASELQIQDRHGKIGPVLPLGPRGFWISGMAWHPWEQKIAQTQLGTVHLWDLARPASNRLLAELGTESVGAPCWSPNGLHLAVSNHDRIILFNENGKQDLSWNSNHQHILHLAWSPDSRWLASCGYDRCLRFWNEKGLAGPVFSGSFLNLRRLAWDRTGRLAGVNHRGDIFVWDYQNGSIRPAWFGLVLDGQPIAFDAKGHCLLGDPAVIDKHFLVVLENETGSLQPLTFAEFQQRHPQEFGTP